MGDGSVKETADGLERTYVDSVGRTWMKVFIASDSAPEYRFFSFDCWLHLSFPMVMEGMGRLGAGQRWRGDLLRVRSAVVHRILCLSAEVATDSWPYLRLCLHCPSSSKPPMLVELAPGPDKNR